MSEPTAPTEPDKRWSCAPPPAASPPALKPVALPYRVQGLHVALFATKRAARARNIMIAGVVVALLMLMFLANDIHNVVDVEKLVSRDGASIFFIIAGGFIAARKFGRVRRFHAIAQAAQREPMAVWGLKQKLLYPLDPKAPRTKLSIVLDATEHTLFYRQPRAPIGKPPEPLP